MNPRVPFPRRVHGRVAAIGFALLLASTAATAPPARTAAPARKTTVRRAAPPAPPARRPVNPLQLGLDARAFEENGAYGLAADKLRELRSIVALDADLELTLALDEARNGQLDSAWARLYAPTLEAALRDTAGWSRRHDYAFERHPLWVNGRFDGWYWYVARARAELGLRLHRSEAAYEAAEAAVRARPLSGKDYLLAALAAAQLGSMPRCAAFAQMARFVDPTLPEAAYVLGLVQWRHGQRNEAAESFRAAMALDSTYRDPALALVRCRLPAVAPDPFPGRFLNGARAAAELTSPVQPKLEEVNQAEVPVMLAAKRPPAMPDSLLARFKKPVNLIVSVLIDEHGRPVLNEVPYFLDEQFPYALVPPLLASLQNWSFRPAQRHGRPIRAWTSLEHEVDPPAPPRGANKKANHP